MVKKFLGLFLFLVLASGASFFADTAHASSPRIKAKDGTSTNWGGYAVETNLSFPQNNAVSDVQGNWTVPSLNCLGLAHNTYSSAWVGIDGYSDNTVEQTGTEHDCVGGVATYSAWYELYPKFPVTIPTVTMQAGDVMFGSVHYNNDGTFTLTLTNTTNHQTSTTRQKARAKRQSAEWIVEAPYSGGVLPLANFGTLSFTNAVATLNGVPGPISAFANDPITMVGSGYTKAAVSSLTPDGTSFTMTWNHE